MSSEDKTPVSKIDETKPVVWTAEDASRFMTSAIREAQKPLADALKQRPMTSRALTLVIMIIIAAALIIGLILSNQLEKTERRAEGAQHAREEILGEKMVLQAQTQALEDRLNAIQNRHDELYGQVADLKANEERHRRTISELARFRQNNEILREHISGLESEKAALSTKLLKALSIEPGTDAELDALINATDMSPPAASVVSQEPDVPGEPAAPHESIEPIGPEPTQSATPIIQSSMNEIGGAMAPPVVSEPAALTVAAPVGSALPPVEDEPTVVEPPVESSPEPAVVEEPEPAASSEEPTEPQAALVNEESLLPPPSTPAESAATEEDGEAFTAFESTSEQYGATLATEPPSEPETSLEPELIIPVAEPVDQPETIDHLEPSATVEEEDITEALEESVLDETAASDLSDGDENAEAIVDEAETVLEATYSSNERTPVDEQVEDMIVESLAVDDTVDDIVIVDTPLEAVVAPEVVEADDMAVVEDDDTEVDEAGAPEVLESDVEAIE
ncbi:MAG: hypothetical protein LUC93_12950 [Planctomycetaceae bacterium]|nr:hypothetical protein [Planctomycetaceae bacterium]